MQSFSSFMKTPTTTQPTAATFPMKQTFYSTKKPELVSFPGHSPHGHLAVNTTNTSIALAGSATGTHLRRTTIDFN